MTHLFMFAFSVENFEFCISRESFASNNENEYRFNPKIIWSWPQFSGKSFTTFERRRSREKGFIHVCRLWYVNIIYFFLEDLKQNKCESRQRISSMSLDGDGFWIVLVNGIGSENLRSSLDTMKVGLII